MDELIGSQPVHSIIFDYIPADKIYRLESLLSSTTKDELKSMTDRYVLMSANPNFYKDDENLKDLKYVHMCDIVEIMWNDLKDNADNSSNTEYDNLVFKYGKDIMDMFVLFDSKKIESKIITLIDTAMKAFKCNKLEIQITKHDNSENLINVLMDIFCNHYFIHDNKDLRYNNVIIIEKRGK